jgi:hypothetical protein
MKDIIRMNQLAGIITEGQARKMIDILNENSIPQSEIDYVENIVFLKKVFEKNLEKNKQKLAKLIQFFNEEDENISYEEMIEKYGKEQTDSFIGFMFDLNYFGAFHSKHDMMYRLFGEKRDFNS